MNDWYLYIIQCNDDSLYTGITLDVDRRLEEHASQGAKSAKYVKGKGPLKLVFSAIVGDKGSAYRMERKVKSLSKKKKMDIVRGELKICELL